MPNLVILSLPSALLLKEKVRFLEYDDGFDFMKLLSKDWKHENLYDFGKILCEIGVFRRKLRA